VPYYVVKVKLHESVTKIGDDVFWDCRNLTSIVIPDSVTGIGNQAFLCCTSLTSIVIPNSVTVIGDAVFSECASLTSIVIPNSVTAISNDAFYNCISLTSIVIPDSITTIGNQAFYNCTSLTSIVIPDSKTMIGDGAFHNCTSLPLCTAVARCLTWVDIRQIFSENMPAIHEVDGITGFPVFVLAAVGPTSDIEAIYNLLREYPPAIVCLMNNSHPNTSTGTTRKRSQDKFVKKRNQKVCLKVQFLDL